jgi:hypothetical protein
MADDILKKIPLPADLPENWTSGQIIAPTGAEAGLDEQHGYNYLMKQVNNAQKALKALAAQREEDLARIKIWASTDPTSPASFIGGTWERIEGKFVMGASDTYPARSTGGEAAHALTINETPNHVHYVGAYGNPGWQFKINGNVGSKMTANTYVLINNISLKNESITDNGFLGTSNVGGDEPHNNLPPYIAVYIWVRVDDAA